ncbi:uncharacterized protein LOC128198327 [Bicyclus anynana]|uniref:Uncharacterized protein LOC128198327 n=1 Tax=Bicyclus anynana TaxID=110368 RepID=A0ABM3LJ31_BICAN|nr:uncharacterized protein LOC128198327 [Bicyclus anynana]
MSQYPHIFLDKNSNSKEETYFENQYQVNDKPYRIVASAKPVITDQDMLITTEYNLANVLQNLNIPKDEDMLGAIMPSLSGSNYKITVKMSPKNKTDTNAQFKEVHTTVNKSFDENGFRHYTLLNMSQISKIETLNKTDKIQGAPLSDNDQKNQIKALLKLHKNNIDRQLHSLFTESNHLEKFLVSNKIYNIDRTINLYKDEGNSSESVNEEKLYSLNNLEYNSTETTSLTTISPASSKPVLTDIVSITTEMPSIDKTLIIDTIKQNEKVTYEILKKIDTNTEVLQTILQKISDKLDLDNKESTAVKTTEKPTVEIKFNLSKDWKTHGRNRDLIPVPSEFRNGTVPFVYAYQESIPMNNKAPSQLWASLVYQGHIMSKPNAENMTKSNYRKSSQKIEPNVNKDKTKTFNEPELLLKDLNNFKIIPNEERVITANIKINTTKV